MDSLIKSNLKKLTCGIIDRKSVRIFLISVLSGIIAHLYYMVNLLGSDDVILAGYGQGSLLERMAGGVSTGRIFGALIDELETWYRSYYVSGWIIILTMAVMALIIISAFNLKSTSSQILTAVFVQFYPTTQANVVLGEISYPISFLLSVLAASILIKDAGRKNRIISLILLLISILTMPASISCFLTVFLLRMISDLASDRNHGTKEFFRRLVSGLGIVIIPSILILAAAAMIVRLFPVELTSYQGASEALSGAFLAEIPLHCIQVYKKFIVQGIWKIQTIPALRFTFWLSYVLDAICMILLWRANRAAYSWKRLILLILLILCIPFALCTMTVVSYGFMYKGQYRLPLGLLLIWTLQLLEKMAPANIGPVDTEVGTEGFREVHSGTHAEGKCRSGIVLCGVVNFVIMLYGFFLFDNIGYQVQHHVMEQDKSLCTRILSALDGKENFSYNDPVYFLNITSTDASESPSDMTYDPELMSVIWPVSTTDLYCYGDTSIRGHILRYEGVQLAAPPSELIDEIEESFLRDQYETLKSGDFDIVDYKGITVVVVKTVMPPNVLYG